MIIIKQILKGLFILYSIVIGLYIILFFRFLFITNDGEMGSSFFMLGMLIVALYLFPLWLWTLRLKKKVENLNKSERAIQLGFYLLWTILPFTVLLILIMPWLKVVL